MNARTLFFVPVMLIAFAANTLGQTFDERVGTAVERLNPSIIELRHRIHQNPELSNCEFQTAELVADRLRTLGLEVRTQIAHTGVVGLLKGGRLLRISVHAARAGHYERPGTAERCTSGNRARRRERECNDCSALGGSGRLRLFRSGSTSLLLPSRDSQARDKVGEQSYANVHG